MLHCKEISIYVFLEKELRGLSPNFHSHVSLSDLYFLPIGPPFSCSRIGRPYKYINRSRKHECRNWDWAAKFLFWEYLLQIFCIVSLQCVEKSPGPCPFRWNWLLPTLPPFSLQWDNGSPIPFSYPFFFHSWGPSSAYTANQVLGVEPNNFTAEKSCYSSNVLEVILQCHG